MSDPVRALVVKQLDAKGLTMKDASLGIGRSHSFAAILDALDPKKLAGGCPAKTR